MPRRPASILALLAVAPVIAACGQNDPDAAEGLRGEQAAVADVVSELSRAGAGQDGAAVCSRLLAEPLVKQIEEGGRPCAAEVTAALKDTGDTAMVVESVQVAGTGATARVAVGKGSGATTRTFTFVKAAKGWRISGLGS